LPTAARACSTTLASSPRSVDRLSVSTRASSSRKQIGREGIRLRGLLIEAANLDVLGRAVDLRNQQIAGVDAEIVVK